MPYNNLKKIRKAMGKNQKEFSNELGINSTTYNNYENLTREPKSDFLGIIYKKFGISADYVLGLSSEKYVNKKTPAAVQEDNGKVELDDIYYSLNEVGQEQIIDYARYVASKAEFKKCDKTFDG